MRDSKGSASGLDVALDFDKTRRTVKVVLQALYEIDGETYEVDGEAYVTKPAGAS